MNANHSAMIGQGATIAKKIQSNPTAAMSLSRVRSQRQGSSDYASSTIRHRLEAARRLGWESMDVCFVDGDDDEFRLWENAENLHRSELTPLERSEHIAEWIRLTEKEDDKPAQPGQVSEGSNKPAQLGPVSKGGRGKVSGINAASKTIGVKRQEAQRAVKIDAISPEPKQAAREAGLRRLMKAAGSRKNAAPSVRVYKGAGIFTSSGCRCLGTIARSSSSTV